MTPAPLTVDSVRRRFLIMRGLRWLPTGFLIPVIVLVVLERGLSIGQLGLVFAAQGLVVLVLELPTGGLADAVGRRRVLLVAAGFDLAALALLVVADTPPLLAVVFALQGVYRSLESGPLDSWYVDTARALDPDADIEAAFSASGAVTGVVLSLGSVAASVLVATDPLAGIDALVIPVLAALALRSVDVIAVVALMREESRIKRDTGLRQAVAKVPALVATALRTVRASRVLIALVVAELLWGIGLTAVEALTPAKLGDVLEDFDRAAAVLGPTNAGAFLVAGGGAAVVPLLTRRRSAGSVGAWLRLAQAASVAGIALAGGPAAIVGLYVLTMGIHGASDPVHQGLLHRGIKSADSRATIVSANSLTGQTGFMLGSVLLGRLADGTSLNAAIATGALIMAVGAPLYLVAGRGRAKPSQGV